MKQLCKQNADKLTLETYTAEDATISVIICNCICNIINKLVVQFSNALESHVVQCSMESFMHRLQKLIYLHYLQNCFMKIFLQY